jgi:Domain of unknown function (DUF4352)
MPPLPKKKRRTGLVIFLVIAALLVFGCIGVGAIVASQSGASNVTTSTSSSSNSPGSAQANVIGKPVVVNADWTVTLNSASIGQPGQFDQLKPGDELLIVNVTLRNTSSAVAHASTIAQWSLHDASGQTYNQDITVGSGPDGTVAPNSVIRGNIGYEVPKSTHSFTLQFVADIGSSDIAEWNVTV